MSSLTEEDSIACHLQQIGMGSLICKAAIQRGEYATNEVTPEICFECKAGIIYRKIGCDSVLPKIYINNYIGGSMISIENLFCKLRKRNTTIEYCETCTLKVAHTTKAIILNIRDIFEKEEFYSAFNDLEKAKVAIRDGNNELAITYSITMLESTMRIIHEKIDCSLPTKAVLTDLYKSIRVILKLSEVDTEEAVATLTNSIGGMITCLGHARNSLSVSHGKGVTPPQVNGYTAELILNSCSTLATFLIRRYKEIKG